MSRRLNTIAKLTGVVTLVLAASGGWAAAQHPAVPPQETAPKAVEAPLPGPAPKAAVAADPAPDAPAAPAAPKPPPTPLHRSRYDVAVLEALDKVTAESLKFEAPVGRPIRYKSLIFTVKACERSAPDEAIDDSIAYITIDSQPRAQAGKSLAPRQAFKGWMYASSPGLNPLQHPVYDAWLITCRATAPVNAPLVAAPAPAVTPKPAPAVAKPPPAAPPSAAKPLPEVVANPTSPPKP